MSALADGKRALDEQLPRVYQQLRRIARSMLGASPSPTVTATGILHEAYARLAVAGRLGDVTEMSFKRIVAHVMREVLCDAARRKNALKRGGKGAHYVTLDADLPDNQLSVERILIVSDFLNRLQSVNPRQASVVELLYFGGLTFQEIAADLNVSVSTVERDWRTARAWLSAEASKTSRPI